MIQPILLFVEGKMLVIQNDSLVMFLQVNTSGHRVHRVKMLITTATVLYETSHLFIYTPIE